jgi:transketolase
MKAKAKFLRKSAFEIVMSAGKGHLGGSLSCTEILVALYYGDILRYDSKNPAWEGRDRFILSKGHANNVLYVVLADCGFFDTSELLTYTRDGSALGGHCDPRVPGIEIISGSLGHGLGIAAGISFGAKLDKRDYLTFVLLGDGECQEGSVWEAASFAAHHSLNNLIAIVDRNGLGSEEFTENSCKLEPFDRRWRAFGWEVKNVDGHSIDEVMDAFKKCRKRRTCKPMVVIANTVKGKGILSLENTPRAHHTLPRGDDVIAARKDLE